MTFSGGIFVTLEGIDGSGKSTQVRLLVERLRQRGFAVCATREPGGTELGEEIRRILVSPKTKSLADVAELALMYAARAQHLEEIVRPALARGEIVVSDRFSDASRAYQGYGRKLGLELVEGFDRLVCRGLKPHLTIVLDVPAGLGLERATLRPDVAGQVESRFEQEGSEFQQRVREGYLAIARAEPRRVKLVNGERTIPEVHEEIWRILTTLLNDEYSGQLSVLSGQ